MSELQERDTQAISTAVRILNEAGYSVETVGKGQTTEEGVGFRLDIRAPTRYPRFEGEAAAVREAAIETPEIGQDGRPVAGDGSGD